MKDSGKPVALLRNIGPKSATMLALSGISTIEEELRLLGAVRAYHRLKAAFPKRIGGNMLWAVAEPARRSSSRPLRR
jgi:hypothetical protein